MAKNITGLGRGLGALIDTETISTGGSSSISEVDINLIVANPNQPRVHFDEDALTELATSIRELGVISPITLRKNEDGTYRGLDHSGKHDGIRHGKTAQGNHVPGRAHASHHQQAVAQHRIGRVGAGRGC